MLWFFSGPKCKDRGLKSECKEIYFGTKSLWRKLAGEIGRQAGRQAEMSGNSVGENSGSQWSRKPEWGGAGGSVHEAKQRNNVRRQTHTGMSSQRSMHDRNLDLKTVLE